MKSKLFGFGFVCSVLLISIFLLNAPKKKEGKFYPRRKSTIDSLIFLIKTEQMNYGDTIELDGGKWFFIGESN